MIKFSSIHPFFLSFQYAGDPIDCFYKDNFPDNFVDNVCWVDGTYTEKYREGDEKQGQAGKLDHLCDGSQVESVWLWNFIKGDGGWFKNQLDLFGSFQLVDLIIMEL